MWSKGMNSFRGVTAVSTPLPFLAALRSPVMNGHHVIALFALEPRNSTNALAATNIHVPLLSVAVTI